MPNLTLQYIADSIHRRYNIKKSKAKKMVANSFVAEMYDECYDYIEHYSIDYWADEIMKDEEAVTTN